MKLIKAIQYNNREYIRGGLKTSSVITAAGNHLVMATNIGLLLWKTILTMDNYTYNNNIIKNIIRFSDFT